MAPAPSRTGPCVAELGFIGSRENERQQRDDDRGMAVVLAWHAAVLRRAVALNRRADRQGGLQFLEQELPWMQRYARGLPDAAPLLEELVRLLCRAPGRTGASAPGRRRSPPPSAGGATNRIFGPLPRSHSSDRLRREER